MVTQQTEQFDVYRALADPTRRTILNTLMPGEMSVNAIASLFEMSRPAVSKHLRILREADLVYETRQGKHRYYHLNAQPLRQVDEWLAGYRSMWNRKLDNLKRYLESDYPGENDVS
jgi:DNA-binding transcriptional ArsR family regulator